MFIEMDGISIEIIRKKIKNLNLRVYPPDGLVKVSAPLTSSDRFIKQFLKEKSTWILTQQTRIREHCFIPDEDPLQTGKTVPFKGTQYLLIVNPTNQLPEIKTQGELMYFYIAQNASLQQKQVVLDLWYEKKMALEIPALIKHWERIINVKASTWHIKKMKTRWGSCNTRDHRISLNLNLIKKPLICLEYVLVHELIHILEASHNQRFYSLMTQFMPQWREYKRLLEQ